jgi:hypothetical protein
MALGAIVATQLTDRSARARALYLDGLDVLFEPGSGSGRLGVPIETIRVVEAGPNGVSSMDFVIEDPGVEVSISEGSSIRYHDIVRDAPLFTGFVQSFSVRPAFGDQGRTITVRAIGVEVLLDWAVLGSDLVFAGNFDLDAQMVAGFQSIVAAATGLGPLRALADPGVESSQAFPISGIPSGHFGTFDVNPLTIPAGTSVREAIRRFWENKDWAVPNNNDYINVTIDFTMGLRIWDTEGQPSDYTDLTIVDTPVGAIPAANLDYSVDAAGVVRGVWVVGTGVTLFVSDATGLPGPINVLTDATVSSVTKAQRVGQAYLASFGSGLRGSYELIDRTPVATVRPGSRTVITDARVGLAATSALIAQIEKTFNPSGREDWAVSFGGPPPSGAALIRRLTRTQLS